MEEIFKKNEKELFEEFKFNFGFAAYDEILKIYSRLYITIEELKESREKWKKKYMDLKHSKS